jgi:hypothetical protein
MIKELAAFGGIAGLGVAAALLLPVDIAASAPHFHGFAHHRHDRGLTPFGGVVANYPLGGTFEPASAAPAPIQVIQMVAPLPALSCQHSQQTVTVPSEGGGERKITITRC